MATIRLLLYTDQPLLAHGLASLDLLQHGLVIERTCTTLAETRDAVRTVEPDILLMDLTKEVTLPALSEFRRMMTHASILLWAREISTELGFQAVGIGVRGVLPKTAGPEQVIECLLRVHEGELWFEKSLTDSILTAKRVVLTKREGQLVALLAQGLKNKEIATALDISEGTVKVYMSKLFQKIGVRGRFELALRGVNNLTTGQVTGTTDAMWRQSPAFAGMAPRCLVVNGPMMGATA
jgi:DNA-binding NarL/FixJ family response regulator